MTRRQHWRDCQEWRQTGLPFRTTSNQACKLYDAAITQYAGFYNEPSLGGLEQTLSDLAAADPTNIIGHVIGIGLDLYGTGKKEHRMDPKFRARIKTLKNLADSDPKINDWEKRHVQAIDLLDQGYITSACDIWEDIAVDYPLDMLALKFAFDGYFFRGRNVKRRDTLASVVPQWNPKFPDYGYLLGMYSFALAETNSSHQSERMGRKALDINPFDAWATHSLVHVMELEGRHRDGIEMLQSTVDNWNKGEKLSCHTYWHWAVYNVEEGDYEGALAIYDNELLWRARKSNTQFNFTDCASLLFRLEMEGYNVKSRWEDMYELGRPMLDEYQFAFVDPFSTLICSRTNRRQEACDTVETFQSFMKDNNKDATISRREAGVDLCRAILAYNDGDYESAVNLLHPIRYKIIETGASNAQRDSFSQLFIHAALKSPNSHHNNLARSLISERQLCYEHGSPLTERLVSKLAAINSHHCG